MAESKFSLKKQAKSFLYAVDGLKNLFKEEHNAVIHLVAALGVIIASIYFKLNAYEWIAVIFSIGIVIAAEIFNTAIEHIANFLTTERNEKIKRIKDLGAAAVLICAITAFTIGVIIFLPKLINL